MLGTCPVGSKGLPGSLLVMGNGGACDDGEGHTVLGLITLSRASYVAQPSTDLPSPLSCGALPWYTGAE